MAKDAGGRNGKLGRRHGGRNRGEPQERTIRHDGWTEARQMMFFPILAATGNVSRSARAVGLCPGSAHRKRRRCPDFAAAWEEALCQAYDKLEGMLLERALGGVRKTIRWQGKKVGEDIVYSDGAALRLLAMHRKSVSEIRRRQQQQALDPDAAFEAFRRKFEEIRTRTAGPQ